jgi:hypothetical protein
MTAQRVPILSSLIILRVRGFRLFRRRILVLEGASSLRILVQWWRQRQKEGRGVRGLFELITFVIVYLLGRVLIGGVAAFLSQCSSLRYSFLSNPPLSSLVDSE